MIGANEPTGNQLMDNVKVISWRVNPPVLNGTPIYQNRCSCNWQWCVLFLWWPCISFFFQAQARCHRIGQSKSVKIYRLITRNSYEREMFDKASLKLGLDKAVLQSMSGRENAPNGVSRAVLALLASLLLLASFSSQ